VDVRTRAVICARVLVTRVLVTRVLVTRVLVTAALAAVLAGATAGYGPAPLARASSRTWDVLLTAHATAAADQASGSVQACQAYAYSAIKRHKVIAGTPAACRGLSRAQISQAARLAIRVTLTKGTKSDQRRQAGAAAVWVRALITYSPPAPGGLPAARPVAQPAAGGSRGSGAAGLRLGVSELAAQLAALLAWLATAASGAWMLVGWLLAGGSPRRKTATAAPPGVILGHIGAAALGLVLWACFMLSGWMALGWIALGLLAPVAGLGMSVLLLGLPRPVRPPVGARRSGRRAPVAVLAIAAHGLFAVTTTLLVLTATIGAG
jgi:hypothetical protein